MNQYLDELKNNEYVREKALCGNVHSFNYSNKAFFEGRWDSVTTRARGLFCDMDTETVVARSFDKFFAIDERPETSMDVLKDTLKFPMAAYRKENGFLGICSYRKGECNNLFLASKSTNQGEYADYFRSIFNDTMSCYMQPQFADMLRAMNCSAVFEVIDPIHDPHIVEYKKPKLVLLALIVNDFNYTSISYWMVKEVARIYKLECKELVATINSWDDFVEFYEKAKGESKVEGYVFEDDNGYMLKLKTDWYKYWKRIRSVIQAINKGKAPSEIRQKYRITSEDNALMDFLYDYVFDAQECGFENALKDIPNVRRLFIETTLPKVEQKILLDY